MKDDTPEISNRIYDLLVNSDISKFSSEEKLEYVQALCKMLKLNPLTQPIQFIKFQGGREVPYFTRGATDELRRVNGISVEIVDRQRIDDIYVVTAKATDPSGRADTSTGAVVLGHLKGEALANALMKAETKAKRRVTLSICGLGLLDESETDTIPGAKLVEVKEEVPKQTAKHPKPTRPVKEEIPFEEDDIPDFDDPEERFIQGDTPASGKHKWKSMSDKQLIEIISNEGKFKLLTEDSQKDALTVAGNRGLQ